MIARDDTQMRRRLYRAIDRMLEIADYCDKDAKKPGLTEFQKGLQTGILVINSDLRLGVAAIAELLSSYANAMEYCDTYTKRNSEHEELLEKMFDVRCTDEVTDVLKDEDYAAIHAIFKKRYDEEYPEDDENE